MLILYNSGGLSMQNNCFIRGNGIVKSGEYEKIEICGTGGFGNNVLANKIVVNGSVNMGEKVEADIIEINGTCFSGGSVKCNKIFVNGTLKSGKLDIIKCDVREAEGEIIAPRAPSRRATAAVRPVSVQPPPSESSDGDFFRPAGRSRRRKTSAAPWRRAAPLRRRPLRSAARPNIRRT